MYIGNIGSFLYHFLAWIHLHTYPNSSITSMALVSLSYEIPDYCLVNIELSRPICEDLSVLSDLCANVGLLRQGFRK